MRFSLLLTSIALACNVGPSHQQKNLRSHVAQEDPQEVLDFWTPEKIGEALSNPVDWQNKSQTTRALNGAGPHPANTVLPDTKRARFPHHEMASLEQDAVQRAVGALLVKIGDGYGHCTASVIKDTATDRSLLLTAAHCLCGGGKFFSNWLFVPKQDDKGNDKIEDMKQGKIDCSEDPYGCFVPKMAIVDVKWALIQARRSGDGDRAFDYGVLVVPKGKEFHIKGKDEKEHETLEGASNQYGTIEPLAVVMNPPADKKTVYLGYPGSADPELEYSAMTVQSKDVKHGKVWLSPMGRLGPGASGGPFIPNPVPAMGNIFSVGSGRVQADATSVLGPNLNTKRFKCLLEKASKIPIDKVKAGKNAVIFVEKAEDETKKCTYKLDYEKPKPVTNKKKKDRGGGTGSPRKRGTPKVKTDPHFETWSSKHYEYMGGCDLVLLTAPNFFAGGPDHPRHLALDVHVRTKVRDFYSFVERAAVKIGGEVLEVGSYGEYFLNGVDNATMPNRLSGLEVTLHQPLEKVIVLEIDLGFGQTIRIKTFTVKDFVAVEIHDNSNHTHFNGSLGMMGDYETGRLMARDGVTVMEGEEQGQGGPDAFGAEWQVRDYEEMLFQTTEHPQYPERCITPDPAAVEESRRLLAVSVSREEAEIACGHLVGDDDRQDCIYDVIATGDLELPEYAY